jgi:hypothetical protein
MPTSKGVSWPRFIWSLSPFRIGVKLSTAQKSGKSESVIGNLPCISTIVLAI